MGWLVVLVFSGLLSCLPGVVEDARVDAFKNRLVHKRWRLDPEWARSQGFHQYDMS